jgi:rare lipoprotein A
MMGNGRGIAALQTIAALGAGLGLLCLTWLPAHGDREVQVQDGDSLSSISLSAYGDLTHVQEIADYNGLSSPDAIFPGEILLLPGLDGPFTSVASTAPDSLRSSSGSLNYGLGLDFTGPLIAAASSGKTIARAGPVIESGLASWYGADFDGQTTKCGEIYSEWDYTAASNDLPCGSVVQVTNDDNGMSVVVTITDTGGFQAPDILDLSRAAFGQIASLDTGVIAISVASMGQ